MALMVLCYFMLLQTCTINVSKYEVYISLVSFFILLLSDYHFSPFLCRLIHLELLPCHYQVLPDLTGHIEANSHFSLQSAVNYNVYVQQHTSCLSSELNVQ